MTPNQTTSIYTSSVSLSFRGGYSDAGRAEIEARKQAAADRAAALDAGNVAAAVLHAQSGIGGAK